MTRDGVTLPEHSPLGASGAYRWGEGRCYGSVRLASQAAAEGDEYDDGEFSKPGTAAHALAEACFRASREPWEFIGYYHNPDRGLCHEADANLERGDVRVDKEMADAVMEYVTDVREAHPDANQGNSGLEYFFHCPELHPLFYGASDRWYLDETAWTLHVWDFKYGAGIVVDPEENWQGMYYAAGVIQKLMLWAKYGRATHGRKLKVVIHIHQPRIEFLREGTHRVWETDEDYIWKWLQIDLLPAMKLAEESEQLVAGEHCRFCPVRFRQCPAMTAATDELEKLMTIKADRHTPATMSRILELGEIFKIQKKAAEKVVFGVLQTGGTVPGFKLAQKKADRVWKEGAEAALKKEFGTKYLTKPEPMSPAQIDKLPGGKALTARWAFKPDNGLTIVASGDSRPAVKREPVGNLFKPVNK